MIGDGQPIGTIASAKYQHRVVDQIESQRPNVIRLIIEPTRRQDFRAINRIGGAESDACQKVGIDKGQVVHRPAEEVIHHRLLIRDVFVLVRPVRIKLLLIDSGQIDGKATVG